MSNFKCPYCGIPLSDFQNLTTNSFSEFGNIALTERDAIFKLSFYACPDCLKPMIFFEGCKNEYSSIFLPLVPQSFAKQFPEYVPSSIRQDYEEAYNILLLSPKASATLSRRCLQGMIHDFFGVTEKNLNAEITALKDVVDPMIWKGLDDLRKLGNIGAHMEKDINLIIDIDSDEAEKLIRLIEFLIEKWYITRHETEKLFADISAISAEKEAQRKS